MPIILRFCLRLALVAAGLVLAAGVAVLFMVLAMLWFARALWHKVTGRPAVPFAMRFAPRAAFRRAYPGPVAADVIDVEARRLS